MKLDRIILAVLAMTVVPVTAAAQDFEPAVPVSPGETYTNDSPRAVTIVLTLLPGAEFENTTDETFHVGDFDAEESETAIRQAEERLERLETELAGIASRRDGSGDGQ